LGHTVTQHKLVSDETAHMIDEEIRSLINRNYARAEGLLKENIGILQNMAEALLKYETLDSDQLDDIMAGKKPRPPKDWSDNGSSQDQPENKDNNVKVSSLKPKIGGPASSH
jgi:cell division protease FtsH